MNESSSLSTSDRSQSVPSLSLIFAPVRIELIEVEKQLFDWSKASSPSLREITRLTISRPGKLIRPGLFLLIASHFGYKGKDRIKTAAIIEAIHSASLIHDDIIDNSTLRRGEATACKAFGPEFSLLFGDYLFIKSITRALSFKNKKIVKVLAEASGKMIEGEIEELVQSFNLELTEKTYFKIIGKKTASLFRASCELAAELAGAPAEIRSELEAYGFNLGLVFQIVDDLLDLKGESQETGKARFSDLREGRITLPLIRAIKTWPEEQKKKVADWLKKRQGRWPEPVNSFNDFLLELETGGALTSSLKTAEKLADRAKNCLAKLEPGPYQASLIKLVDFVLRRKK
ncbi:MAG TPA: polyprenyl synthetase family protein [Candidatus Saccharicenans sp.]|jgi:octaprenyl-diphosphate synthase|nr:polyprenyl synthetase family protein [Candidatus Saccharicenans sp.]HRD02608.1 polyprenyl synthetase family protein [Candidatus Saccharicenans sp.]